MAFDDILEQIRQKANAVGSSGVNYAANSMNRPDLASQQPQPQENTNVNSNDELLTGILAGQNSSQLPEQAPKNPLDFLPQAQNLRNRLAKANGRNPASAAPIPSAQPRPFNDVVQSLIGSDSADLKDAQHARNNLQLISMLGAAGNTIGSAIGRRPVDNSFYNQALQMSDQPITDVKNAQALKSEGLKNQDLASKIAAEQEKMDPNSDASKSTRELARQIIKEIGGDPNRITDNMSQSALEKLIPGLEGMANRKATITAAKMNKEVTLSNKEDQFYDSEGRKLLMGLQRDPTVLKAKVPLMRIEKAKNMLENPNLPIDPQTLSDVEQDILAATSGSATGAIGKLTRTERDTVRRRLARFMQEVSSNPQDLRTQDPKMVEQVHKVVNALYDNYNYDIKRAQKEFADNVLKTHGDHPKIRNVFEPYSNYKEEQSNSNQGLVKVSNGSEEHYIDVSKHPEDLEHAKADGFQVVGQ